MEQSSSWKADRSSASQEIPRILWNLKICYRIHKCPPLVLTMSQIKPVHALHPTSWRPILILSSPLRLGLPSGLFTSGFHTKTLYVALHTCYMARPSFWFYLPNIWWAVQVIKLDIMQFSPLPSSLLGPNIFFATLRYSLIVSDQVS
jgi:hypothetical protein